MKNMLMESLTMSNWKCYKFKKVNFSEGINLYEQANGYGKSSIFQAIIYCLYGVLPSSDSGSLKNDRNKPAKLELTLRDANAGTRLTIRKDIVSASQKVCYYKENDSDWVKAGANAIAQLTGSFCGSKNLFPLIWSNKPICDSSVFNLSYIKDNVLNTDFDEVNSALSAMKAEKLSLNKELGKLQSIASEYGDRDIDAEMAKVEKDKVKVTNALKGVRRSKTAIMAVNRAKVCIENKKLFSNFKKEHPDKPYTQDELSMYSALLSRKPQYEKVVNGYNEHAGDIVNFFRIFNSGRVKDIVTQNAHSGECPVCGSNYPFTDALNVKSANDILTALNGAVYSEEQYNTAVDALNELESYDSDKVSWSKRWYELAAASVAVDDPEAVVKADEESKKQLWERLDAIEHQLKVLDAAKVSYSRYLELVENVNRLDAGVKCANAYAIEKTNALIGSILFEAANMLSKVDKKYLAIYYNTEDNCFDVCMVQNDEVKVLSHNLLSSGEQSVLAMCLIMSYRKILREKKHVPNFILLDESLAALDSEHLGQALAVIESEGDQALVVNHR